MNYQHIYHAGHYSDVFKHWILVLLLEKLRQKDTPFGVLDTHAGAGWYDLSSEAAQKTGEAQEGIGKLLALEHSAIPPIFHSYLHQLQSGITANDTLAFYPGSPYIIQDFLRSHDQLIACELNPKQFTLLKENMPSNARIALHQQDAYLAMKAFLPLKQKRGLVLIDPPFEKANEFEQIIKALKVATYHFANGIYAIWYPIKHRPPIKAFYQAIQSLELPNVIAAELLVRPDFDASTLNGCGMVIINPPWQLAETLQEYLPWLAKLLALDIKACGKVENLSR